MHGPNQLIPNADGWIPGAQPNRLLDERDRLLDRPGQELAVTECENRKHPVAIERDHRLVLGNRLLRTSARVQEHTLGEMRKRQAGRCL